MGFYEQISKYYDYIFPAGREQIKFIGETAGTPPKRVLDIACGSGGYSVELSKKGYDMTAVDLDKAMVEMAREKAEKENLNIKVHRSDMLKLVEELKDHSYECIFCIGNSIVHLGNLSDITKALKQMEELLDSEGILVLQIINYDRILKYGLNELPPIKNEDIGLEFIRKYEYIEQKDVINFNTLLTVERNGIKERYMNSIELYPLKSGDLLRALKDSGFGKIEFFGDFNRTPYKEDSYMLVVKARR